MTVSVTVSVLVSVLVLTLVVGGVVVVVVVVVVVGGVVIGGGAVTVSVTVCGDGDVVGDVTYREVVVNGVNVVRSVGEPSPLIRLASPHTIRATINAPSAPKATRAAGLRYHGTGSSGGTPWPPLP